MNEKLIYWFAVGIWEFQSLFQTTLCNSYFDYGDIETTWDITGGQMGYTTGNITFFGTGRTFASIQVSMLYDLGAFNIMCNRL